MSGAPSTGAGRPAVGGAASPATMDGETRLAAPLGAASSSSMAEDGPWAFELGERLAERFLRYTRIASQSDATITTLPTSPGQWELARLLEAELSELGASDIHLSDTSVLTARIPGTLPGAPAIGFCTHLDTADAGLSPQVHASLVRYEGGDLALPAPAEGEQRVITLAEHPELAAYEGQELFVTDGTSVLGADDKAGVAAVMELATELLTGAVQDVPRGDLYLSFVPDEEIGLRGVRTMDLERFPVRWAYTLDCCEIGEIAEETFNAAGAVIRIDGVSAHPMSAFGVLVNPILLAHEVIAELDPEQTPERTKGRQGYTWVHDITGDQSHCEMILAIRDHDAAGYAARKAELERIVAAVAEKHPTARISLEIADVYANIAQAVSADGTQAVSTDGAQNVTAGEAEDPHASWDLARSAMRNCGIEPKPIAMRGGTDGSWLATQGIPTPNLFTGAHNFHSWAEFLPRPSLEASVRVLADILRLAALPEAGSFALASAPSGNET